jgi:transcription termination factor Rho
MSVLSREALEASPLADLHLIAADLEIDGYRRLRKADLIDRMIEASGGDPSIGRKEPEAAAPRSQSRERSAGRDRDRDREPRDREPREGSRRSSARGGERSRQPARQSAKSEAKAPESIEGKLAVQSGGSGIVTDKASGAEIYVSAAQIRRLELSDGDSVGGPVRPGRRSERYPSLVRIETINGKAADEVAPAVPAKAAAPKSELPSVKFDLSATETLKEIDRLAPFGRGSRVVLHGGPHSGKSTAARAIASSLKASGGIELYTVLAGVRVEEEASWAELSPFATETLASSPDSRAKAVERALDKAKRSAEGGSHAVVIVDSVDDLPGAAVRKTLASAFSKGDAGSLTVIVTAATPLGGETTVIGFDQGKAAAGKFPSIDGNSSSTLSVERLLDARGLKAYAKAHSDALKRR